MTDLEMQALIEDLAMAQKLCDNLKRQIRGEFDRELVPYDECAKYPLLFRRMHGSYIRSGRWVCGCEQARGALSSFVRNTLFRDPVYRAGERILGVREMTKDQYAIYRKTVLKILPIMEESLVELYSSPDKEPTPICCKITFE